jgi:hypothetical protein
MCKSAPHLSACVARTIRRKTTGSPLFKSLPTRASAREFGVFGGLVARSLGG